MTRIVGATSWPASFVLLGLLLAGCGGASKSAAPAGSGSPSAAVTTASASSSAPAGFASTSAGTPPGTLSKTDFLIDMNALCSAVDAQRQALPTPSDATDYPAISTGLTGTLRILPVFISHAQTLVARSADRAALERNWLAIERADYAAVKPIAERAVADSNAHNAAKVQADLQALDAAPNHSSSLAAYLRGYGLSSCASLESN